MKGLPILSKYFFGGTAINPGGLSAGGGGLSAGGGG